MNLVTTDRENLLTVSPLQSYTLLHYLPVHFIVESTILDGCTIGTGSVIGAGAVVVQDVPAYSVVVGVPGKVIKSRKSGTKI